MIAIVRNNVLVVIPTLAAIVTWDDDDDDEEEGWIVIYDCNEPHNCELNLREV